MVQKDFDDLDDLAPAGLTGAAFAVAFVETLVLEDFFSRATARCKAAAPSATR